jgi:hypothetical protein
LQKAGAVAVIVIDTFIGPSSAFYHMRDYADSSQHVTIPVLDCRQMYTERLVAAIKAGDDPVVLIEANPNPWGS